MKNIFINMNLRQARKSHCAALFVIAITVLGILSPQLSFGYTLRDVQKYIAEHPAPTGCYYYQKDIVSNGMRTIQIWKRCPSGNVAYGRAYLTQAVDASSCEYADYNWNYSVMDCNARLNLSEPRYYSYFYSTAHLDSSCPVCLSWMSSRVVTCDDMEHDDGGVGVGGVCASSGNCLYMEYFRDSKTIEENCADVKVMEFAPIGECEKCCDAEECCDDRQ